MTHRAHRLQTSSLDSGQVLSTENVFLVQSISQEPNTLEEHVSQIEGALLGVGLVAQSRVPAQGVSVEAAVEPV